jgi:hypothetical protein
MGLIFKKIPSQLKPWFGGFQAGRRFLLLLNENRGGGVTLTGLVLKFAFIDSYFYCIFHEIFLGD